MLRIATQLMTALFLALGVPEDKSAEFFAGSEGTAFTRLAYYPKCPEPDSNLALGPHTDVGALNIVIQSNEVCSLEMWKDGKFYGVPPKPSMQIHKVRKYT